MRLIFTSQNSIYSRGIEFFEGSEFSHVAAVFADDSVIETTWKTGVRQRHLDSMMADAQRYRLFDIPLPDEAAAHAFAVAQIGKKYDKTAIIGFPFYRAWDEDDAWYCSELSCAILKAGGYTLAGSNAYHRVGVRLSLEFVQGLALGHGTLASA